MPDDPRQKLRVNRSTIEAPIGQPDLSGATANVYIDGFNLYYGCLKDTPHRWLDIGAFSRKLIPRNPINRIRYFTARVSARPGNPDGPARQDAYLRALNTIPQVSLHYGHFQHTTGRAALVNPNPGGPRTVEVFKTQEKGSDANLAAYLLLDAVNRDCEIAVVVSNDSDLEQPIRIAIRNFGLPVGLVNPHPVKKRSRLLLELHPLFFKQVRTSALTACQFPEVLNDTQGEIRRPATWHGCSKIMM
jgi:hypothetical protein